MCDACFGQFDTRGVWACPVCHANTIGGICCIGCADKSFLSCHIAILPYDEEQPIGRLVRAYKYECAEEAFIVFERLLSMFLRERPEMFRGIEAIVPVPLHPRRYAERGFNQSDAIAECLSRLLHVPFLPLLARVKNTRHQARLSKFERKANVIGAFAANKTLPGMPRSVLLADDVFTTGSTMQGCAEALLSGGVKEARGFSIARG